MVHPSMEAKVIATIAVATDHKRTGHSGACCGGTDHHGTGCDGSFREDLTSGPARGGR